MRRARSVPGLKLGRSILALARWTAALGCSIAAFSACERQDEPATADTSAPPSLRATLSIEPPSLVIGEVATLELLVVTPPGHHVLPMTPPEVPGLWLLDSHTLEVEKQPSRWLHRTQVRVRPQDVGPHAWPEHALEVEDAEGQRTQLLVPERAFAVRSTMPEVPERVSPFSYQTAPPALQPTGRWAWAIGGAVFAWAVAGVALLLVSRSRSRSETESQTVEDSARPTELFAWAEAELRDAKAALDRGDPGARRDAANKAARTMRQFISRRFDLDTEATTTPELASLQPPLRVQSRWPYFVRILESLDDWRFRPRPETPDAPGSAAADPLAAALEEASRFVADAARRGARR